MARLFQLFFPKSSYLPAPHPVCKHTCIHEVLGSTFEYGLLMAAVRGPNAANQAWSRADGGHPGRGEDWAGVNSVLSQTGEGVGGRKERGKRKGRGNKEESKWDKPAPGRDGAEAQGRDPCIHGHPLGRGRHLKQLRSELTNL